MDWTNKLYFGDNLKILREHVPAESVDLIYPDPPFNSSATYNVLFKEKSGAESAAQITAFEDTWQWSVEAEAVYKETVAASDRLFQELIDSRTSKVHEILKCKGKAVRVIWVFKSMAPVISISKAVSYPLPRDCIVEGCNSHFVELKNRESEDCFSEPIENVLLRKGTDGRCLDILIHRS
jgi:hypothetical protein